MKYILMNQERHGAGDILDKEFAELKEAIQVGKIWWNHLTRREKETREIFVIESINPDETAADHFDGTVVWEAKDENEAE